MRIQIVFIVLALLVLVHSKKNKTIHYVPTAYRPFSGVFAATWLGGFCMPKDKCDIQYPRWDRQSFTIHGFWPNPRTDKYFSNFSLSNIQNNIRLYSDMLDYWPAQSNSSKSVYQLWDHEYYKHGKDYAHILQFYDNQSYWNATDSQLQQSYFQAGIDFYKMPSHKLEKLDISKAAGFIKVNEHGLYINKSQLAEIIHIKEEYFWVRCQQRADDTRALKEIHICFRIHSNLTVHYSNCQHIQDNNEATYQLKDSCPDNKVWLVDFGQNGGHSQTEVTRYTEGTQL